MRLRAFRLLLITALILLQGWALQSCGTDDSVAGRSIAVSYPAQEWLVRRIAGEDFDIAVLVPPGADSETFDPDMRTMARLEKADVYLTGATIGFESATVSRLASSRPDLRIADISKGVRFIGHTHSVAGHDHEDDDEKTADPHILGSFDNAAIMATNIFEVLKELNPSGTERYAVNYESLMAEIRGRRQKADSLITAAGARNGSFVVMHPSLSYFARDYGLRQVSLERDGKEPSPAQWAERVGAAIASHPRVLFYEQGHSAERARQLASTLGVEAKGINLTGTDFLEVLSGVAEDYANGKATE